MNQQPQSIRLADYKPYPFVLETTRLDFELEDHATIVRSELTFHRNPKSAEKTAALKLNGEKLKLNSVKLDGRLLGLSDYEITPEFLTISNVPERFVLNIEVVIDPKNNTELMGLYQSRGNFCTQCEAHGFRKITYFPDRPDVMTRFTVSITADCKHFPYLLSNGNLIETKKISDTKHFALWQDPSLKPCYLFALVAGDFDLLEDTFITMAGRNVDLRLYVEKGLRDQAGFAMKSLQNAMRWDEEKYGREYDLDIFMIVAVNDFNFGAMENKGLNIFNSKYILAKPDVATDSDYLAIEKVVGHEYFHNWSGNRVTCRDWFQITLKEGLTVFRDQSFTADLNSSTVERIDCANIIRNVQFLQDAGPMAHPIRPESYIEINNFYTVTVYNKGSEVIRMVHTLIGPEQYRKAMDLYFSRHDGQAVTTENFIACMAEVSGRDFTQFCRWYHQAGTPVLNITSNYDAKKQAYSLTVQQSCPATADGSPKLPFHIPLSIALFDEAGRELVARVLDVTKPEETFVFENIAHKPIPSLLRNFSAPVKLEYMYTDAELAWLMQHDTDAFNRWNAAQEFSLRVLKQLISVFGASHREPGCDLSLRGHAQHATAAIHPGKTAWIATSATPPRNDDQLSSVDLSPLVSAFSTILQKETDFSLAARMMSLPSESYLLQQIKDASVEAVHYARQFLRQQLAEKLTTALETKYRFLSDAQKNKPYVFNAVEAGTRSLKNSILHYLSMLNTPAIHRLTFEQFHSAKNMTDQIGALSALNDVACLEREAAFVEFHERWENETLVMDKWLMLQAQSFLPDTLENVKKLLKNPVYDPKNPNKIRALVGGFTQNLIHFHAKDGSGYHFLTDQVQATDLVNPMTAARLVEPFTRWKQFDMERQALMKNELERLLATPHLSKDVYEVVSKSLV